MMKTVYIDNIKNQGKELKVLPRNSAIEMSETHHCQSNLKWTDLSDEVSVIEELRTGKDEFNFPDGIKVMNLLKSWLASLKFRREALQV